MTRKQYNIRDERECKSDLVFANILSTGHRELLSVDIRIQDHTLKTRKSE